MKYTFVRLPSGKLIEIDDIREMYDEFKNASLQYSLWKARPALIAKDGQTSWLYTGQKFDPDFIELVPDAWTHDHCLICSISISDTPNEHTVTEGYFDGSDWICRCCYETIILSSNLDDTLHKLPQHHQ